MTAFAALTRIEFRLQLREISSLLFPFGLPLLILIMNGMGGGNRAPVPAFGGYSALEAYVMPLVMMMVVTIIGLVYVPAGIAEYRNIGVLRRLAVTPVRPVMILLAQAVIFAAVSLLGSALAFAVGRIALGVGTPGTPSA